MVPNENSQSDHHIIRDGSTIYEDRLKIIAYPAFLLVSWNILASTKSLLVNILKEEYEDLHRRILLYRLDKEQQITDFLISDLSGVLRLSHLASGIYYCEISISNSKNDTIVVKRSNELRYINEKDSSRCAYQWNQLDKDDQSWIQTFSGYTLYE